MVPLYDRPLWTLHWENKGLKEFHFLKKQNLESEICYAVDLPLKTKQDKTNPLPLTPGSLLWILWSFWSQDIYVCGQQGCFPQEAIRAGMGMAPKGNKHGRQLAAARGTHLLSYLMGLLNSSKKMKWIPSIVSVKRSDSGLLESVQPKLHIRG